MTQTQNIFYNFNLNQPDPLDVRFRISTMSDIPVIEKRYSGLIFFVVSENIPYIFLNDLNVPIPLFQLINSNNLFGITSLDYMTLVESLNSANPVLGSLITVYPLGVTFIFDGNIWKYHSGVYNIDSLEIYDTIPSILREPSRLVTIDENRYIIANDKSLKTEVIDLLTFPELFDNNRYYKINSILYYALNGVFYKIGEQTKVFTNQELLTGKTTVTHNLNSAYISAFFWIYNTNHVIRLTEYETLSVNEINIKSNTDVIGTLLLSSNF